jgi:hypothetical protein
MKYSSFLALSALGISAATALAVDVKSNFTATVKTVDSTGNNVAIAYQLSGLGNNAHYSAKEYGDQITLASGVGTILNKFTFDYFANYSQLGGMTLSFYSNNGAVVGGKASPGTLLGSYNLDVSQNGALLTVGLPFSLENAIPSTFTWAVKFNGADGVVKQASLIAPDTSATVGSNDDTTFWERASDNSWQLATLSNVPEPSECALMGVGVAAIALVTRRKK